MPVHVMPDNQNAVDNHNEGEGNADQADAQAFLNYQRYDLNTSAERNVLTNANLKTLTESKDLDEEIIRRRGKRVRKSHIVTRSMNPIILATRKSPVKKQRESSVTLEMLKLIGELSKSPNKRTPVKRLRSSPPSSPGMMTRKRLNMSVDSGIGSSPTTSTSGSSGNRTSSTKKSPVKRNVRSRSRRNLRRLH